VSDLPKPDADWSEARPREIPHPTAYPAGMAFGTTLLFWGFITSPVLVGIGLVVMTVSLAGWIGEMRHER
jgi:hypothetical protein